MKINMDRFKPVAKPIERPAKRFKELPGGIKKRESERFGGPLAEKRRRKEMTSQEDMLPPNFLAAKRKYGRRSAGIHSVERPVVLVEPEEERLKYNETAEEHRAERFREDSAELNNKN